MGSDEGGVGGRTTSPYRRKYTPPMRNGSGSPTRHNNDTSPWDSYQPPVTKFEIDPDVPLEAMAPIGSETSESESDGQMTKHKALLIGNDLLKSDPNTQDEMQRKKERIMMQSLRRRQEQEESRIQREEEARRREEEEKIREEEKLRKKEEEKARRDAILEQHRIKKELEKQAEEQVIS